MTTIATCQPTGCTIWDGAPEEELETLCCLPIVETFADLRTLNTDLGYFPSRVSLRGHTYAGDGGGGEFNFVTGQPPGHFVDDNGIVAVFDGGDGSAAMVREIDEYLDIRAFGAVLDGVTDDRLAWESSAKYGVKITAPDAISFLAITGPSDVVRPVSGWELHAPRLTIKYDFFGAGIFAFLKNNYNKFHCRMILWDGTVENTLPFLAADFAAAWGTNNVNNWALGRHYIGHISLMGGSLDAQFNSDVVTGGPTKSHPMMVFIGPEDDDDVTPTKGGTFNWGIGSFKNYAFGFLGGGFDSVNIGHVSSDYIDTYAVDDNGHGVFDWAAPEHVIYTSPSQGINNLTFNTLTEGQNFIGSTVGEVSHSIKFINVQNLIVNNAMSMRPGGMLAIDGIDKGVINCTWDGTDAQYLVSQAVVFPGAETVSNVTINARILMPSALQDVYPISLRPAAPENFKNNIINLDVTFDYGNYSVGSVLNLAGEECLFNVRLNAYGTPGSPPRPAVVWRTESLNNTMLLESYGPVVADRCSSETGAVNNTTLLNQVNDQNHYAEFTRSQQAGMADFYLNRIGSNEADPVTKNTLTTEESTFNLNAGAGWYLVNVGWVHATREHYCGANWLVYFTPDYPDDSGIQMLGTEVVRGDSHHTITLGNLQANGDITSTILKISTGVSVRSTFSYTKIGEPGWDV